MRFLILFVSFMLISPADALDSRNATFVCAHISNQTERKECTERAAAARDGIAASSWEVIPSSITLVFAIAWPIIYFGIGLVVARYIYRDAKNREWVFLGIRPVWWAVLTAFQPVMGILTYWATNYSRLTRGYFESVSTNTERRTET